MTPLEAVPGEKRVEALPPAVVVTVDENGERVERLVPRVSLREVYEADAPESGAEAVQHALIAVRVAEVRTARTLTQRRQAGKRAQATLVGHLRRFHGWTGNSAGRTLDDLATLHDERHSGGRP